jgi:hypothetical protein
MSSASEKQEAAFSSDEARAQLVREQLESLSGAIADSVDLLAMETRVELACTEGAVELDAVLHELHKTVASADELLA